jgi:hypothetical protein
MFNLITSYYKSNNSDRQKELNECLKKNHTNNLIEKIYLLNDSIYQIDFIDNSDNKIVQIVVDGDNKMRLGFDYVIDFANSNLQNKKCIISNSDIYFDETLGLLDKYDFAGKFFGLTRYDDGKIIKKIDSQDCWIFQSPLKTDISKCNFKFGHPGCDNRFAHLIKESGYNVINPCLSIKSHHLHSSNYRTYSKKNKVFGPYHFINFSKL